MRMWDFACLSHAAGLSHSVSAVTAVEKVYMKYYMQLLS